MNESPAGPWGQCYLSNDGNLCAFEFLPLFVVEKMNFLMIEKAQLKLLINSSLYTCQLIDSHLNTQLINEFFLFLPCLELFFLY